MKKINQEKFSSLKQFNLPISEYAITGSGLLGILNLRAIGDIDIIVSNPLWRVLATKYGITNTQGVPKIVFPDGIVEAFREGSFQNDESAPKIADRIAQAEVINGLPFDAVEHILHFKRKEGRDKDLEDIHLLETYLARTPAE